MADESGGGLPASIAAAWGLRERPGKGPKPGLSLRRIVEAAIEVGASDGLAAVSMNRVAAELGASTMSLYRYVASKDELLMLITDAMFETPPPDPAPGEGWRPDLTHWAQEFRATLQQNTWALRIPISGPPLTPNVLAWLEGGLRCLRGTGLAEHEKMSVMLLLTSFIRTEVTLMADLDAAIQAAQTTPDELLSGYSRLLATLTDAERFPALHAVIDAGVFDIADGPDDEYLFGLQRILDGIESLVRARS